LLATLWANLRLLIATLTSSLACVHHLRLILKHFLLSVRVLLKSLQLLHLLTKIRNHTDEYYILLHNVVVLFFMDGSFFLETLLKTVRRVLKISELILMLLFDIWINLNVLHWLVSDVRIEILVDNLLELIKVINVLNNPIDSILKLTYGNLVRPDLCSVLSDHVLHVLLSGLEIINDVTQVSVNSIIMLQVLVHVICLFLEPSDLLSSWCNVSLQLLDFVIKHELELF